MATDMSVWFMDTNVLAAVVSAVVSIFIWILFQFRIEPRRWKSRYEIRSLERKLEVHGWLISVLKACEEKARRQQSKTGSQTHLMETSDILQLEGVFGRKAYLLSEKLRQTWYELQRKDTYFEMMRVKNRETMGLAGAPQMKHELTLGDLTEMQRCAERDFADLQGRYITLTGQSDKSTPGGATAPTTTPSVSSTPSSLRSWLEEENALSSIDLVYFLLVPITLFVVTSLDKIVRYPEMGMFSLLVFPGSLFSLPFGLHAKMTGSIGSRILAWAIYIVLSSIWFGAAVLANLMKWLFPAVLPSEVILNSLPGWFFILGNFFFGMGIAAGWLRWVWRVFVARAPTRRPEMERALTARIPVIGASIPLVSQVLPHVMHGSYRTDIRLFILGAGLYAVFILFSHLCTTYVGFPLNLLC
jgi:hypothetical protein